MRNEPVTVAAVTARLKSDGHKPFSAFRPGFEVRPRDNGTVDVLWAERHARATPAARARLPRLLSMRETLLRSWRVTLEGCHYFDRAPVRLSVSARDDTATEVSAAENAHHVCTT